MSPVAAFAGGRPIIFAPRASTTALRATADKSARQAVRVEGVLDPVNEIETF